MIFDPNNRHIIVISGKNDACSRYAKHICSDLEFIENKALNKAQTVLGHEYDAVIFTKDESFDANAFGAITGTIRGGGYLILLQSDNLDTDSLFLTRFDQLLHQTHKVTHLNPTTHQQLKLKPPPRTQFTAIFANDEQKKAVTAIIKVVTGHRRRPLMIIADRGRGKSAALGISIAKLAKQGLKNIILCAPSKNTVATVFKHAKMALENNNEKSILQFYSPDDLLRLKPPADLVLIDEAAAIPLSLLTAFAKHYSRIVFSSTQHGYEGSGRGFAINFCKVLNELAPQWKQTTLNKPIRWNTQDNIEQFTFDALLLDAEAADFQSLACITLSDCQFSIINKRDLLDNPTKLRQLFGLLVSAHYQTKPSDLQLLLDDGTVSIYSLEKQNTVIAVALVIQEGNIQQDLLDDIFAGNRRIKGHLVAQALSSTIGIKHAPQLSGDRISRIAVHPSLQGKGFGSHLLNKITKQSTADYLSTSFGATKPLINFWKSAQFSPVHLSIKRDTSSGAHSVTMLYPKTENGYSVNKQAKKFFTNNFLQLLSDTLRNLESDIVFALFPALPHREFSEQEDQIIKAFANNSRGYENCLHLLTELVSTFLSKKNTLSENEKKLLIAKILQRKSWLSICQRDDLTLTGKKEALEALRKAIVKLLI